MEEESPHLFELYDSLWFRHHVLLGRPFPAVSIPEPDAVSVSVSAEATGGSSSSSTGATQVPPGQKSAALRRTLGDEVLTLATSSDSALLAARPPVKLHTILSGKEASDEELEEEQHREAGGPRRGCSRAEQLDEIRDWGRRERKRRHRERRRAASQGGQSKSLSELEFEELKGFMDLGFTFPEAAESDQRLLSIVPGLRRRASSEEEGLAKEAEDKVVDGGDGPADPAGARRPYLSEAWKYLAADHYQEEGRNSSSSSTAHDHLLRNWRVPATGDGVDMKGHLRSWAHTVASAVQ